MAYRKRYRSRSRSFKKSRRVNGKSKRGRRTFQSRVKAVVLKASETKKYQFADENVQLYHNIGYTTTPLVPSQCSLAQVFNIWADINKGTGSFNRIGDKITPRGMSIKMWLANKSDRPNVMYRIIVATTPKAIGGTAVTNTNVDPWDDIQLGSNGNKMIRMLDFDRGVKVIYDRVCNLQAGFSARGGGTGDGKECHLFKKLWIRKKSARTIVYDSTGSNQIVNNPIHVWVIPYDSYGTLTTDNIASMAYQGCVYYKDF